MRYITERELREQFASGVPDEYSVPDGCALTPPPGSTCWT